MPKIVPLFYDYVQAFSEAWDMPGAIFGWIYRNFVLTLLKTEGIARFRVPSFVGIFACHLLSCLFLSWWFHAVLLAKVLKSGLTMSWAPIKSADLTLDVF